MRSRVVGWLAVWLFASALAFAQARALITSSQRAIQLPNTAGDQVVLGSVSLGQQRNFNMFNIQAAGTITPDPDLNGATFQVQFLVCDQPDCTGEIKSDTRILPDSDSATLAQVIATRSFGVSTHSAAPVVLSDLQSRNSSGNLYLAVALKLLHGANPSSPKMFLGKLTLLRVEVMP